MDNDKDKGWIGRMDGCKESEAKGRLKRTKDGWMDDREGNTRKKEKEKTKTKLQPQIMLY